MGLSEQLNFGTEGIDSVNDQIWTGGENGVDSLLIDKGLLALNKALRIDQSYPLLGNFAFLAPQGGLQGQNLPVDIGGGDHVKVNEEQPADTAARQSLNHISADRAQTDHNHITGLQPGKSLVAQQFLNA